MTEQTTTTEEAPKRTSAKSEKSAVLARFLKASGYEESDILDHDERRRTFVTDNGGKYHLLKSGKIQTVSGPEYPNANKEEEEEAEV